MSRPRPALPGEQGDGQAFGPEFAATVLWQRYDEFVDAALVEIDEGNHWQPPESLEDIGTRPPQRWGHLIGSAPYGVVVPGFPRMQKQAKAKGGRWIDEQVIGTVNPGNGSLAHRYEISSQMGIPAVEVQLGNGTVWSGLSGAAVLAGPFLCGVIREDRRATGGTRLTATQVAHLVADEEFRQYVEKHSGWEPVLEPVEPAHLLIPAVHERRVASPAALLRADVEAVAFHGRDSELAELTAWCTEGPAALSARVLTGPGGQGKTRLARQLTTRLGQAGWVTGHLRPDLTDSPDQTVTDFGALATALPMLLVVDYAETRPYLVRRLVAQLLQGRHRVRLLLLARADGDWLTDSLSAAHATRMVLNTAAVIELAPLMPRGRPAHDRLEAFRSSARDLARLLPAVASLPAHAWSPLADSLVPVDDLNDSRYENVLTLQMTALTALLQQGPTPVHADRGAPAEKVLLLHEERFWLDSANAPAFGLGMNGETVKHLVAVAALCGAEDEDEALGVVGTVTGLPAERSLAAVRWLSLLYPSGPDGYWGSLQPDRVAEFHAAEMLIRKSIRLPALLSAASPGQQAQVVTVLARSAVAHYNNRRTAGSEAVLKALDAALEAAPLHYEALRPAAVALGNPSRIIRPLGMKLIRDRLDVLRQRAADDPATHEALLGRVLSSFAGYLAEAGDRTGAAAEERRAIEIHRRHAAQDPEARDGLARSLSNLGFYLSELGRWDEALAAGEESVVVCRDIASTNAAFDESVLAVALSNLSIRRSETGRHGPALEAAEEAAEIQQRLAGQDQAAHERGLARSLSNMGVRLSENGRWTEALAAEERAAEVMRRRAAIDPAACEAEYADSLFNLGVRFSDVGRWQEALAAEQTAVDIYRRLAADNPARHEPDLAGTLGNLANFLSEAGLPEKALAAVEEAVRLRRRLAEEYPAVHEPDLAAALQNLGNHLSTAGDSARALSVTEEAVEIRRRHAEQNPDVHRPDHAAALFCLGVHLRAAGRREDGVRAVEQALEIYRGLRPGAARPHQLALTLVHLVGALPSVGRNDETLALAREAEAVYRQLGDNPALDPARAGLLVGLADRAAEAGDREGALEAGEQALEVYRRLSADRPDAFEGMLAVALSAQGVRLSEAGRHEEALVATEEAVALCRRRAAQDSAAAVRPELALALGGLVGLLEAAGRTEDVLPVAEEAVETSRRVAEADPVGSEHLLALALNNLARCLVPHSERWPEGRAAVDEAVEVFRRVATRDPGTFEQYLALPLAAALWLAAEYHKEEQDLTGALELLSESEQRYEVLVRRLPGAFEALRDAVVAARTELLGKLGQGADRPGAG
ncbi:tetratricopeptide repeat protein [Kitasatospora sp. NPDC057015]|uniref:tetratricopeptide repeat protein n=1 Tax=Kitasatospora sp. NPDC057015 TaxID=3346001 RepID=UPI003632BC3A